MTRFQVHQASKVLIIISSGLGVLLALLYDGFSLAQLAYFTNQSNLLVFLTYFIYLIYYKKYKETFITILYQVVLAIVLTSIVYHLMLRPYIDPSTFQINTLTDLLVHTITPLLVIGERIVFGKKGILQRKQPWIWLSFPLFYYVFVLTYGLFGGRFNLGTSYESKYPYFFLNLKEEGVGYFMFIIALILFIGYIMVFMNRIVLNRKREKNGII